MQRFQKTVSVKWTTQTLCLLLGVVVLFSCRKENQDLPSPDNELQRSSLQSSGKRSTVDVPYSNTIFASCANGGAGENIELTGKTNFVYKVIWTDHGFNLGYHANTYAVKGIGLTTGDTYVGSAGTEGTVSAFWMDNKWVATTIERLRVVGPNGNFGLKNTYHITTNPDGIITVDLYSQDVECK